MKKITLKAARVNAGFTREEAAKQLKVCRQTVKNWEDGTSCPSANMIDRICAVYDFDYNEIIFSRKDN